MSIVHRATDVETLLGHFYPYLLYSALGIDFFTMAKGTVLHIHQFLPRSDEIKAKLIKDYFQQQFNDESEPKL